MKPNEDVRKSNMALWNEVFSTDPKYTKKVNQRGGFTAIDAYYRIMTATELWGPIGHSWRAIPTFTMAHDAVICNLELTYPVKEPNDSVVYSTAACMMVTHNKDGAIRVDTDAHKKSFTDAITKALSYLGFSADVFLGKFDDNKYVQEQNEKYGNNTKPQVANIDKQAVNNDFI